MARFGIDKEKLGTTIQTLRDKPLLVAWFALIILFTSASLVPEVGVEGEADKLTRALLFTCLTFLPTAFDPRVVRGLILGSFMAPLGFVIELLQRIVPGRNFSPEDMIANNLGAILGMVAGLLFRMYVVNRKRKPASSPEVAR